MSMDYITMEWRVRQHASKAVESTASGATAAIQWPHQQHRRKSLEHLSTDPMKKDMEELAPV